MDGFAPSARDRLLLAFAELGSYGIAAEESVDVDPEQARSAIAARLRRQAPQGLGSYVFWVRADEVVFTADGELRFGLPLYTSGDEVDRALHAVLAGYDLEVRSGTPELLVSARPTGVTARSAPRGGR
jgi:hypothetical protein